MDQVNITYWGHACFSLEYQGYCAVLDPYKSGMIPGLPSLKLSANAVYCSHNHGDHSNVEAVTLQNTQCCAPYTLEEIVTPHDDHGGKLRGMNTVRIFRFGGLRVAHLGDIGCFPDAPLLGKLKNVDCLLIPVGGFFTINSKVAKQIVDAVEPTVCIPMHYRTDKTGLPVISHLKDFTSQFDAVQSCDNTFVLTKDTPKQILILNYKR